MGKIFIPVAWLMGVPADECDLVANLVALKTIVNEFAAYSKLSEYIAQGIISVWIEEKFYLILDKIVLASFEWFRNEQKLSLHMPCVASPIRDRLVPKLLPFLPWHLNARAT